MILQNFCGLINMIIVESESAKSKDTGGNNRFCYFFPKYNTSSYSLMQSLDLLVSTDDTEISINDYTMDTDTGLTLGTSSVENQVDGQICAVKRQVTNNTENDIVIRKLGVTAGGRVLRYSSNSSNYYAPTYSPGPGNYTILIAESKLDNPFIVKPGESYILRYEIRCESPLISKNFLISIAHAMNIRNLTLKTTANGGGTDYYLCKKKYNNPLTLRVSDDGTADNNSLYDLPNASGLTVTRTSYTDYETGLICKVQGTATNSGENAVTIRKVGIIAGVGQTSSGDPISYGYSTLWTVSTLDTPIIINPGETYSFSYEIRINS